MNGKKAKQLRKQAGYDVNKQRTTEEDYTIVNTSEQFATIDGTNPDGSPKYRVVVIQKCVASVKEEHVVFIGKLSLAINPGCDIISSVIN